MAWEISTDLGQFTVYLDQCIHVKLKAALRRFEAGTKYLTKYSRYHARYCLICLTWIR